MKKRIMGLLAGIVVVAFVYYLYDGQKAEYKVITIDEAPTDIRTALKSYDTTKFSVFEDEKNSYIYYDPEIARENDYISVSLKVHNKFGQMVISAHTDHAVNDGEVNNDVLIQMDKIDPKTMVLKEIDKR
ncbi:hypothetical protein SY83_07745 [Paenibacillus swuensis]|uniref:Uncharacterized protein n=1 Tax=Paenibacillus swuensis TaxID=1178515 RepID=A0A172TGP3_9BACL|nr:hypothetical protein [Paenibacillus swuensis]ANE46180.1 hypothetical protein SY83_07745 [Paenibacillus swuensis]